MLCEVDGQTDSDYLRPDSIIQIVVPDHADEDDNSEESPEFSQVYTQRWKMKTREQEKTKLEINLHLNWKLTETPFKVEGL